MQALGPYSWMRNVGSKKNYHCSMNAPNHEAAPTQIRCQHLCHHEKKGPEGESLMLPNSVGERVGKCKGQTPRRKPSHGWKAGDHHSFLDKPDSILPTDDHLQQRFYPHIPSGFRKRQKETLADLTYSSRRLQGMKFSDLLQVVLPGALRMSQGSPGRQRGHTKWLGLHITASLEPEQSYFYASCTGVPHKISGKKGHVA